MTNTTIFAPTQAQADTPLADGHAASASFQIGDHLYLHVRAVQSKAPAPKYSDRLSPNAESVVYVDLVHWKEERLPETLFTGEAKLASNQFIFSSDCLKGASLRGVEVILREHEPAAGRAMLLPAVLDIHWIGVEDIDENASRLCDDARDADDRPTDWRRSAQADGTITGESWAAHGVTNLSTDEAYLHTWD